MTTDPVPTTVSAPMVTPGFTITPAPSHTLSATVIGCASSQSSRRRSGSRGWVAVSSWTPEAIWQLSPMLTGAGSRITQP